MKHALRDALAALESHGEHALADKLRAVYVRRKVSPADRLYDGETQAQRRERERKDHVEETARIRALVWRRSDGRCENPECRTFLGDGESSGELHHTERGAGRRRQQQRAENCIRLCGQCHRRCTANDPDRAAWRRLEGIALSALGEGGAVTTAMHKETP
jgi:5-methylcytosine-specific restriction endonuclease McrA